MLPLLMLIVMLVGVPLMLGAGAGRWSGAHPLPIGLGVALPFGALALLLASTMAWSEMLKAGAFVATVTALAATIGAVLGRIGRRAEEQP